MEDRLAELYKKEYKAAKVYGKILTMPEIKRIVMAGEKNRVIENLIKYCEAQLRYHRWPFRYRVVIGCNIFKPTQEKFKFEHYVQCSDGKKREYVPSESYMIPMKIRADYPEVEAFIIREGEEHKGYAFNCKIDYDTLEAALLDEDEQKRVKEIRLAFSIEKVLQFLKEHGKSDISEIRIEIGDDGVRCLRALHKMIEEGKVEEIDGMYAIRE